MDSLQQSSLQSPFLLNQAQSLMPQMDLLQLNHHTPQPIWLQSQLSLKRRVLPQPLHILDGAHLHQVLVLLPQDLHEAIMFLDSQRAVLQVQVHQVVHPPPPQPRQLKPAK